MTLKNTKGTNRQNISKNQLKKQPKKGKIVI
mgnify:CR=1 FL=1